MQGIEFYTYEDEVWCRFENGQSEKLTEYNKDLVNALYDKIKSCYTDAFSALEEIYGKSRLNVSYYKYIVVRRFVKCNFSKMDGTYLDIDSFGGNERFNPERVDCPIRGECPFEGRVCMPVFNTRLTERQTKIAKMLYEGKKKEEIANEMYLSWDTINCHVNNIYKKLGVHSEAELVRYIVSNHVF